MFLPVWGLGAQVVYFTSQRIKRGASRVARRDLQWRAAKFRRWVSEQSMGGAGGPRALPKDPRGWQSSSMDPEDPAKPLNKQQEVDKLQKTWGRWWKLGEKRLILRWPGDLLGRGPPLGRRSTTCAGS
eukprot:2422964-Pyramimonas_sp.AAC.1